VYVWVGGGESEWLCADMCGCMRWWKEFALIYDVLRKAEKGSMVYFQCGVRV